MMCSSLSIEDKCACKTCDPACRNSNSAGFRYRQVDARATDARFLDRPSGKKWILGAIVAALNWR